MGKADYTETEDLRVEIERLRRVTLELQRRLAEAEGRADQETIRSRVRALTTRFDDPPAPRAPFDWFALSERAELRKKPTP